jgi:hypothetical protein
MPRKIPIGGRDSRDRAALVLGERPVGIWAKQDEESRQLALLCSCGRTVEFKWRGCCRSCYDRWHHSIRFFGGLRERVLERDHFRCSACQTRSRLLVHHRDQHNQAKSLVTLCIRCHMRIHRSVGLRRWLSGQLLRLWREMHPSEPEQLQLAFNNSARNDPERRYQEAVSMPLFTVGDLAAERRKLTASVPHRIAC